jgi:hypothetical protein
MSTHQAPHHHYTPNSLGDTFVMVVMMFMIAVVVVWLGRSIADTVIYPAEVQHDLYGPHVPHP